MEIPRFTREKLNPRLVGEDIGDAFQAFVHELLLPEYPDLHLFPGAGKDGAIDLSQTVAASRTVAECKQVGKDGYEDTLARWREVAKKLETHLSNPSGPTKFQAQYGPWYRTQPAISEYLFCVSSVLGNQEQIDRLQYEIAEFFRQLGAGHSHLSHLTKLPVRVVEWNDLCTRLKRRPQVLFRWFPSTRPEGLIPLDEVRETGTFRSFLDSGKLPYYSFRRHLAVMPAPPEVRIRDEEDLFREFDHGDTTGLVLTGRGGVGKTRLAREIGWLAQHSGWLVLQVRSRLRMPELERLAGQLTPENKVLLLIDYVEIERDFSQIVEFLNDLNDTYSFQMRYVASCRIGSYQTVAGTPRHKQVNLSPVSGDSAMVWLEDYRHNTVRHILEHSGLAASNLQLTVCRNTPILAVFVSYL